MTLEQELDAVRRVQNGDMDAFERLVTANEKQVFHLAKGKLGNEQDAQDATQETFLKVYTSIGKFRGDCRFSVWVYRIATNVCLDMLRKKGRRPEVSLVRSAEDEEEETETQVPDVELSPEVLLEKKLTIESVRAGLETLPDPRWWTGTLSEAIQGFPVSYVLTWRNASDRPTHFFAPFAGQESADDFAAWILQDKITVL